MRKWLLLLPALLFALGCVGQKEDPEEVEGQETGPVDNKVSSDEGTRPFHRVLALEFTATWCQYCPNMATALHVAQAARSGRIMEIAVHQYDEIKNGVYLDAPESDAIVAYFKASGFPKLVLDWDESTMFGDPSTQRIIDYVDATVGNPTCNIAIDNSFADGKLQVKVSVKADAAAAYSVAAALVQDRIIVEQVGYGPGYSCMAVLREFLGAGMDGESLGTLEKDAQKSFTFTTEIDLGNTPEEDFRVVAFVRKDGRVVNAINGALNGKTDYQYEKEDS